MIDRAYVRQEVPLLVAVLASSLGATSWLAWTTADYPNAIPISIGLFLVIFCWVCVAVVGVGVPTFNILRKLGYANWVTAILCGVVAGFVLAAIFGANQCAAAGALAGAIFFGTWRIALGLTRRSSGPLSGR